MKKLFFTYILIGIALSSCNEDDVQIEKYGDVNIKVLNEFRQPLEEALVSFKAVSKTTDPDGNLLFRNLPIGEYEISISKQSFLTKIEQVTVLEGEVSTLEVTLLSGEGFLELSESMINVNSGRGFFEVDIQSNGDWIVETASPWLEPSTINGGGNQSIKIEHLKNIEDYSRVDTIFFISGAITKKMIIHQAAPLKMMKYSGIIGNNDQEIKDSVYLFFNKPVSVESIQSNWELCVSDLNFLQTDNRKGIKFTFSCAELGGKYPFTIKVKDDDGNSLIKNIVVPFFDSKLDIEGFVTDIMLINQDKELLICTIEPSRILRYSIGSNAIIQTYDISSIIAPIKISFNPYNDKVYIMGNKNPYYSWEINSPDVYILDYNIGDIQLAFTVQPDEQDHPSSPANIPYNIGFTKNGLGIVLLKADGSSALRWKLIDSSNNDSVYVYPHYNNEITEHTDFNNLHLNFDQSKLFLTQPYGSVNYGIFDGNNGQITILRPSSVTRGKDITPNKKEDKFYARQLYDQFIIDINGNLSQISYLDSRHDGNADFSYRVNEDNLIYICEAQSFAGSPNSFKVLDYNSSTTLKSCDVIEGLEEFSSTVDGKYGVAYKLSSSDKSSSIYVFNTERFYSHIY